MPMFKKKSQGEETKPKLAPDECMKTYQFRIYPNKEQIGLLGQVLKLCRQLYNACLQQRVWAQVNDVVSAVKLCKRHWLYGLISAPIAVLYSTGI